MTENLGFVLRERLHNGIYRSDRQRCANADLIVSYDYAHLALVLDLRDRLQNENTGTYGNIGAGSVFVEIVSLDEPVEGVGDPDYYPDDECSIVDDIDDVFSVPVPSGGLTPDDLRNHPFYDSVWDGENWVDTWLSRSARYIPKKLRVVQTETVTFFWNATVDEGPDTYIIDANSEQCDDDDNDAIANTPAGWESWTVYTRRISAAAGSGLRDA